MRPNVRPLVYAVILLVWPPLEMGFVAPWLPRPWIIFSPLIMSVAFFALPRRSWWAMTLLGAAWRDLFELSLVGVALVGALVLGIIYTLATRYLTHRSLLSDTIIVAGAVLVASSAMVVVMMLNAAFGGGHIELPDLAVEGAVLLIGALGEAWWLRRHAARYLYV